MKLCQTDSHVDDYLLDRLDEAARGEFEEHYFNCPSCFTQVSERAEILAVIKARGATLFAGQQTAEPKTAGFLEKLSALLSPRQWTAAALSAALVIAAGSRRISGSGKRFRLHRADRITAVRHWPILPAPRGGAM